MNDKIIGGRLSAMKHGAYSANHSYATHLSLLSQVLFKQGTATRMTMERKYFKMGFIYR